MKRLILTLTVLCLMLCACTGQEAAPTTVATVPTTAVPTTEPTTAPTTEPTTAPTTEPEALYRHPLTGLPVYEPVTVRPVALVTNNSSSAMPQHGTSQADILVEILAEGGITRNLAFYTDLTNVPALGSVRSARTYFQSLSKAFDAILVHSGDSVYANEQFRTGRYPHVDGMFTTIFYRDQTRLSSGYATEHTLFVKGEKLFDYVNEKFEMETDRTDYGFRFNEDLVMEGEAAESIKISFFSGGKYTNLSYDAEKNGYSLYQYRRDYVDGNTGEKVYFPNVLILYAKMQTVASSHVFHTLEGSNIGYYATGGKIRPITWTRAAETDHFTFTYEDGTPVEMTPGTTYIGVVHKNSVVTYE